MCVLYDEGGRRALVAEYGVDFTFIVVQAAIFSLLSHRRPPHGRQDTLKQKYVTN